MIKLVLASLLILAPVLRAADDPAPDSLIDKATESYLKGEDSNTGQTPPLPKIEKLPDGKTRIGVMILDPVKREIVMPGQIATWQRNIEVLIASPRGRAYEALLEVPVRPFHFQVALLALGLNPGKPAQERGDARPLTGDPMIVFIEYTDTKTHATKRLRVEALLYDEQTKRAMKEHYWVFVGSRISDGRYMADVLGDLVVTMHHPDAVVDNSLAEGSNEYIYNVNEKVCPKPGTKVSIIVQVANKPKP